MVQSDRPSRPARSHQGGRGYRGGKRDDSRGSFGRGGDNRYQDRPTQGRDRDDRYSRDDRRHQGQRTRFNHDDRRPGKRDTPYGRDGRGYEERRGSRDHYNRDKGGNRERFENRRERDESRFDGRSYDDRPPRKRTHAQRAGRNRDKQRPFNPQRSGYREERLNRRLNEPELDDSIDITLLDKMVLQDINMLAKRNADAVAKHLVMAATLLDDDPQLALRHARAAKDRAGRIGVVRETAGIAAYRAGEWKEALAELRAARRMSGGPGLLAVMADAERGLGRPEKAVELASSPEAQKLDPESKVELAIVAAGARMELGQPEQALVTLERQRPSQEPEGVTAIRLAYAYADILLQAGKKKDAKEWFEAVATADSEGYTDAEDRAQELA